MTSCHILLLAYTVLTSYACAVLNLCVDWNSAFSCLLLPLLERSSPYAGVEVVSLENIHKHPPPSPSCHHHDRHAGASTPSE